MLPGAYIGFQDCGYLFVEVSSCPCIDCDDHKEWRGCFHPENLYGLFFAILGEVPPGWLQLSGPLEALGGRRCDFLLLFCDFPLFF